MTASQRQRAEQERVVRYVLDALIDAWDEDVHVTMRSDAWVARVLDNYEPSFDLSVVEAELLPLANHLRNLCNEGAGPQYIGMHDRVRKALHEFRNAS